MVAAFLVSFTDICWSAQLADKPNVIYILADDAGINNIGAYGGDIIRTPNIDSLAQQGMLFTQHYSGSTVCAPSRSVLMTGRDTGSTRIRHNRTEATLLDEDITVAEIFKAAGYHTAVIGKWGLGQAGSPGVPNNQGFDYFYGFLDHENAHRYYPDYLWRNQQQIFYKRNQQLRQHYSQDLFTQEALGFIERSVMKPGDGGQAHSTRRPFFLFLAYTAPHVDLDVPLESMEPYLGKLGEDKGSVLPLATIWGYREHPTPKAAFAGMISRMDNDIGKILAKLDALGLADNTLVMFASDNGPSPEGGAPIDFFASTGKYRGGKRDFYEGGIRMPFIARWPAKIPPGTTSDHLSGFVDVLPTFADLLQVRTSHGDGISFLPTLLGQGAQPEHPFLYWELESKLPLNAEKQAIRQGKWKLLRLSPWMFWSRYELYNLEVDPAELHDQSGAQPEIVARLSALMDSHHRADANYPLRYYGE